MMEPMQPRRFEKNANMPLNRGRRWTGLVQCARRVNCGASPLWPIHDKRCPRGPVRESL